MGVSNSKPRTIKKQKPVFFLEHDFIFTFDDTLCFCKTIEHFLSKDIF